MKWTSMYHKAITFSYDDGVLQDRRFVELLNRYHLKCTFNINSGIGPEKSQYTFKTTSVYRIDLAELPALYFGHEVAIHSYSHPNLTALTPEAIHLELSLDKANLESLFGYKMVGMAYPFGQYNDTVVAIAKALGIRYARTVENNHSFKVQSDLLRFQPTCHHNDPLLPQLIQDFLSSDSKEPQILSIWGHSYEFDGDANWDHLEAIFRSISNRTDVFYGTNAQVLLNVMN